MAVVRKTLIDGLRPENVTFVQTELLLSKHRCRNNPSLSNSRKRQELRMDSQRLVLRGEEKKRRKERRGREERRGEQGRLRGRVT